jgi:transposase
LHHTKLDKLYKQESNTDVKERILLVRRIIEDKQHIVNVAKELHRCRAWAYKWYKRYNDKGLEGLKDKERSGRPSDVPKEIIVKIRQELEDSNTGWDFRQVMDLIYKKIGVRYHEVLDWTPIFGNTFPIILWILFSFITNIYHLLLFLLLLLHFPF